MKNAFTHHGKRYRLAPFPLTQALEWGFRVRRVLGNRFPLVLTLSPDCPETEDDILLRYFLPVASDPFHPDASVAGEREALAGLLMDALRRCSGPADSPDNYTDNHPYSQPDSQPDNHQDSQPDNQSGNQPDCHPDSHPVGFPDAPLDTARLLEHPGQTLALGLRAVLTLTAGFAKELHALQDLLQERETTELHAGEEPDGEGIAPPAGWEHRALIAAVFLPYRDISYGDLLRRKATLPEFFTLARRRLAAPPVTQGGGQ